VPALAELLRGTDQPLDARVEAADALAQMGAAGVAALEDVLRRGGDATSRRLAAEALGRMGEQAVPALVIASEEVDGHTREDCARALGAIGDAAHSAIPALVRLLADIHPWVRWEAAEALGAIRGGGLAIPGLMQAVGDSCQSVRLAATVALGRQGTAASVATDLLLFATQDAELCDVARDALAHIAWSTRKCATTYARRRVASAAMAILAE
jgi:HEAT repeat protein